MTQEEKQLLFKDLCARLPYNVVIRCTDSDTDYKCFLTTDILHEIQNGYEYYDYKPYLRPMSSMTDDELMEFGRLKYQDDENWEIVEMWVVKHAFLNIKRRAKHSEDSWVFQISRTEPLRSWKGIDWLIAHHFDYRGLIPMGLALEAPKDMYKTE